MNAFLEKIGANTKPVSITRLGKGDSNKTRPLKIKFANEDVKENVMAKLSNLKQAEDRFKKVCVTDDYTLEERQEIRSWVGEAKVKNRNENGNYIWKARGSPKNGMRLVKFAKQ